MELPKSIEELVGAVVKSYDAFDTIRANLIFLSLQSCMIEIMKVGGSHDYETPHMKKAALESRNELPVVRSCDISLVQDVLQYF